MFSKRTYSEIPTHELPSGDQSCQICANCQQGSQITGSRWWMWALHALLVIVSLSVFLDAQVAKSRSRRVEEEDTVWSPVLDAVPLRDVRAEETFGFRNRFASTFRDGPVSEVDEQWALYTRHPLIDGTRGTMAVDEQTIRRLEKGKDPRWRETLVKLSDTKQTKYMVSLDLFHHMHCLNELRQSVYRPSAIPPEKIAHLEHCVETIREAISCTGGTGLVTFHWMANWTVPWPDFNILHQCRDPEEVLRWALDNSVSIKGPLHKPAGSMELSEPPYWTAES